MVDSGLEEPTGNLMLAHYEGTSMAAPHVAGVASLAMAVDPDQHAQLIATIMDLTVSEFASDSVCAANMPLCGNGIVNAHGTVEGVELLKPYTIVWEFYHEGVPFYAKMHDNGECPLDTVPVYRYYNMRWKENDSNHRYATHLNDKNMMNEAGWVLEGVAMCAPG